MLKQTSALSLIVVAGLTAGAAAQVSFYRVGSADLSPLCDPLAPANFVGSAPTAIAFDGTNLYVGGANASATASPVQIVRVNDVLGAPTFTPFPETIGETTAAGDGYQGFDLEPATGRLLATRSGTRVEGVLEGAISLLAFDETGALASLQGSNSTNGDFGARSGPAWDYGAMGAGYDYLPFIDPPFGQLGDGVVEGPVPGTLVWANREFLGLFEGLPTEPPNDYSDYILNTNIGSAYFDNAGLLVGIVQTSADTTWRDVDVHPTMGTIVARANNQLIVSARNPDNTAIAVPLAERITPPNGVQSAVPGQNCQILTGLAGGDVVIWNDRWSADAGKPFNVVQRVTLLSDKSDVPVTWLDGDGSPLTFGAGADIADGNGQYAYSWDEASQTLAICDSASRIVTFFTTQAPPNPCVCEFDAAQGVNVFDLLAYLDAWFVSGPTADIDGTAGVNVFDLLFYLDCWFPASAGAPC
jgi:hypothetical protein